MNAETVMLRQAGPKDVGAVLDLLTHYDVPRTYFEPQYLSDPCYRPAHSWVADADGELVAHLRMFPRVLRLGAARLPVVGIGNVVTARERRGQGLVRRLLARALRAAESEPYAYAMLWTHLPQVYAPHGFDSLEVEYVSATVPPHRGPGCAVSVFHPADLPEVERFARRYGAGLSGTTVRSRQYWQGQLHWLDEDPQGFLVARDRTGSMRGYVRSRAQPDHAEILELAVLRGDRGTARTLLAAVAHRHTGALRGLLPASQHRLLERDCQVQVAPRPGPMLRFLNPACLADALSRLLSARLSASGRSALDITVENASENILEVRAFTLRADSSGVRAVAGEAEDSTLRCRPAELARLLLGGASAQSPEPLRRLLPARDWVLWDADRV